MKWNYIPGPNSFSPGARALPSAWWPGAASPSQSQKPPQHGADPQMTGGCSRTLQLPSRTGCPFQSQAHLKARTWRRIAISAKSAFWCTKQTQNLDWSVYSPTTKMIFASLILSETIINKQVYKCTPCVISTGKLHSDHFCDKPSRRSFEEELHSVESAVHVFPIVQPQGTVLPGQLGWCDCML